MKHRAFVNGRLSMHGTLVHGSVHVDCNNGRIVKCLPSASSAESFESHVEEVVDLGGAILAPSYLDLQTNGSNGFHFTHFQGSQSYQDNLRMVSKYLVTKGVTAFWVTIPTVAPGVLQKFDSSLLVEVVLSRVRSWACEGRGYAKLKRLYNQILPQLAAQPFEGQAALLGAHCEGPFINPSKKGAHDSSLMRVPAESSPSEIFGKENISHIKLVTLAPELPGSFELIRALVKDYGIAVSLGHSAADFETGLRAINSGARALTHVFNAMNPLHHRYPGLAGLMSSPEAPFYSLISDGIHLHPSTVSIAFHANPKKCILITDSIELAGLPDGVYPGHAQIPHKQRKEGSKVCIDGTDTLIGGCSDLDQCVRNLMSWAGCSLPAAVRCATENIANFMGEKERGLLEAGRRADFVVLNDEAIILKTFVGGVEVFKSFD